MNLTRKQELALIEIGLNVLLRNYKPSTDWIDNHGPLGDAIPTKKVQRKRKRRLSKAARMAISRRMKAMWKAKRGN